MIHMDDIQKQQLIARNPQTRRNRIKKSIGWDDKAVRWLVAGAIFSLMLTFTITFGLFYLLTIHDNPPMDWNELYWVTETVYFNEDSGDTEPAVIRSEFCKYTEAQQQMRGSWVDGIELGAVLTMNRSVPPGCYERNIVIDVPSKLPTGEYYLELQATYEVNHFAERIVTKRTENPIQVVHLDK